MDRRAALGVMGLAGVAASEARAGMAVAWEGLRPEEAGWDGVKGEFVLPPLPYKADALEPHIDAATMEVHHGKHHAGYVAGANKAMKELARIREGQGDPGLVKFWSRELAFHGSGHVNHSLFWRVMAPAGAGGGGSPEGVLAGALERDFGSFEKFVAQFKQAAAQVEGSGWAWLVVERMSRRLMVLQGEKQQDMTIWGATPILGVDVWEHAYYLKYQNRRAEYVNAFMNVINWGRVGEMYAGAMA